MAALIERFARRYAADGFAHPRVAATVVTARGWAGQDRADFAAEVGLTVEALEQAEMGHVDPASLPEALSKRLKSLGLGFD